MYFFNYSHDFHSMYVVFETSDNLLLKRYILFNQIPVMNWVPVVHTCYPSYLEG
jgi:hypothetical protein